MSNAADSVKVLVLGDSGVGKTTLVQLLCQRKPSRIAPDSTIGCRVDVLVHEYREGTPRQRTVCVELWDVGSANAHASARPVFYAGTDGILLVYDTTNCRSREHLTEWLSEALTALSADGSLGVAYSNKGVASDSRGGAFVSADNDSFTGNHSRFGNSHSPSLAPTAISDSLPVLVIGCKRDQLHDTRSVERLAASRASCHPTHRSVWLGPTTPPRRMPPCLPHLSRTAAGTLERFCAAQHDQLLVDCLSGRHLVAGSSGAVCLSRFIDSVVDRKLSSAAASTPTTPAAYQQGVSALFSPAKIRSNYAPF